MKGDNILRDIPPDVLVDNFEIDHYEKTEYRFDIWIDEKKIQMRADKYNNKVISYGFGEYQEIQDFPIRDHGLVICHDAHRQVSFPRGELDKHITKRGCI